MTKRGFGLGLRVKVIGLAWDRQARMMRLQVLVVKDQQGRQAEIDERNPQDKTRQGKTRQDKTRQDKTRQDKTRQDKTRQGRQGKARQGTTRQDGKTRQGKTRQEKKRQDKYKHKDKNLCGREARRGPVRLSANTVMVMVMVRVRLLERRKRILINKTN
jgi:hypothetical protein